MFKSSPIILIICGLIFFAACKNDPPPPTADEQHMIDIAGADYKDDIRLPVDSHGNVDTNSMAKIEFFNTDHDFGLIKDGQLVSHSFSFINKGVKDLQLLDTKTTCGCTISKYSKEPIKPGAQGFVDITFDSEGRSGQQEKIIRVYSNTYPNETLLKIKGLVISPPEKK